MQKPSSTAADLEARISTDTARLASILVALASTGFAVLSYTLLDTPSTISNSMLSSSLLMALTGWICVGLSYKIKANAIATVLIFTVQAAGLYGLLSFGTIRGAGSIVFLATVVAAGIFLGIRVFIIALLTSIAALGWVTYAEIHGLIAAKNLQITFLTWMTHAIILVAVACLVFYTRRSARKAYAERIDALEENKRLAQERDRSLTHFTRIFRTNPSPMLAQHAANGKIVDVNPAFERCYGYAREEILGQSDHMLWAVPMQREHHVAGLKATGRAERYEATGLRSDGSQFEGHIRSEMGTESEDNLVITIITDMSEQSETLKRLRRSEDRFSKAFNFSPLNMAITRIADDVILEVNQSSVPAQGMIPDQMRGKKALDLGFWPGAAEREAFVSLLAQQGRILALETQMRHSEGHLVNARVWAEQIEIDGEPCILSCTVNIDAEKQREALLIDIAKGMAATTAHAFCDTVTRHMALALKADMVVLGELNEGLTLKALSTFVDGTHQLSTGIQTLSSPCKQALNQSVSYLIEKALPEAFAHEPGFSAGGYQAYLGLALRDEQQRPIGLLKAMWKQPIDVTPELQALMSIYASRANAELLRLQRDREIQRLNEQLETRVRERTADLQKLNAELDSFAYSVSHDLKTPLRSIDGFTQLLGEHLQGRLSAEENRLFVRILTATQRMSQLIADLLALARVSQGDLTLSHLDFSGMVDQVIQADQTQKADRPVRWRINPGMQSYCDPRLARIALDNLLGNALKYTRDQQAPQIEVGRWPAESPNEGAFYVRDNGVGFDMVHSDKLFKPFQRLHMPSEFDGTGIGLATVRRIVERHGGFIVGHGQTGQGAIFVFAFSASVQPPGAEALAQMLQAA